MYVQHVLSTYTYLPTSHSLLSHYELAYSLLCQQLLHIVKMNGVDDYDDEEDIDDLAPLIGSSASPLELEGMARRQNRIHSPNFWWLPKSRLNGIMFALLLLAGLTTVLPLAIDVLFRTSGPSDVMILPSCDMEQFNETFEELKFRVEGSNQTDLCILKLTKQLHIVGECHCSNPFIGLTMVNTKNYPRSGDRWSRAFDLEKERVEKASQLQNIEVAFLGDSITEHWLGTDLGNPTQKLENHSKVFNEMFTRDGGGAIDGIVLGIAGERCKNVLYRLQQGVLGDDLDPKVFWLLVGTNDLGGDACSVEAIVAGNIAIIEELQRLRPHASIVVNGLLPRPPFLWFHAKQINQRLQCYAAMMDGVYFFDATDIFLSPEQKMLHLPDQLHPDEEGHRLWGKAIVDKILGITGRP